jgi:hypothetical protein
MINKIVQHLCSKIDDRVSQLQESLGSGSAKDFVEYKSMVGEIKGLLTARLNIKDLETQIEESDD